MAIISFDLGRILMVKYPEQPTLSDGTSQHITQNWHPAVIIADPKYLGRPRFRDTLYQIVPATTYKPEFAWAKNQHVYPLIPAREGGFKNDSVILLDQIMTLDLNYLLARAMQERQLKMKVIGSLNQVEMQSLLDALVHYLQSQKLTHLES